LKEEKDILSKSMVIAALEEGFGASRHHSKLRAKYWP